jgi:tetratricopeptide (TPR) repeat protein
MEIYDRNIDIGSGISSLDGSAKPGGEVSIRPSQYARWISIAGGFLVATLIGALAGALVVLASPKVRESVYLIVILGALSAFITWLTLNFGTKLTISSTHVSKKPLVGQTRAIAWSEVINVKRQNQRLNIVSRFGEKITIGGEFFQPELWPALRQWLPPQWHRELAGTPGFADRPRASRAAIVLNVAIAACILLANQAARKFDWRSMDARCFQESLVSIVGPERSCLDRAAAAHDADWMQYLLHHRADPNRLDLRGDSPLHSAIRHAFPDGVDTLLKARANPLARNRESVTPIELAARSHDYESLGLMIGAVKARANRQDALYVLDIATRENDTRFRSMVKQDLAALLPKVSDPMVEKRYMALAAESAQALDRRDYGLAITKAESAIALDPQIGIAYGLSGYAYSMKQNWGRAKSRLSKAVELMPNEPSAYASLANVYFLTGDFELAEENATRAMALTPEDWQMLTDRAIYRSEAGRNQAALEDAAKACEHGEEIACELRGDLAGKLAEENRAAPQP